MDWREQTQPCLSQWPLPHKCCNVWPLLLTSTSLSQSVTHHHYLLCQKVLTVASIAFTLQSETHPIADLGALSEDILLLQGEMNATMGWLLTTRASMDTHQRRLVSNTETTIKEAKALCMAMIWDAEAKCTAAIREAETACTDCTHTLQQSLDASMQDLKCEAIEQKGWDGHSFL